MEKTGNIPSLRSFQDEGGSKTVSNCQNTSTSTNPGETTSKCLLCFQEEVLLAEAEPSSSSGRSKLVKNLCEQLQLDSAEIPEQCDKRMFPFCDICESELDLMFEHKQIMLRSLSIISLMAKRMEKKVVREAENWRTNPVHQAGDKFTKLWDMIIEGYRERQSGDTDVDATRPMDSQSVNPTCPNDVDQEQDHMETNNLEGETVTVNVNPESCPLSVTLEKGATIGQPLFTSNDIVENRESDDDDEIQQVSTSQKRRTLCEGVEYFQRIRRPGNETYLQCSLCPHTVPNVKKKFKPGELTPHRILASHMQTAHKRVCEKKASNTRSRTSANTENGGVGAQSESSPQQPSTSRNPLNLNSVEGENELINLHDPEHLILEPRKRKYIFHSVEISKYVGSQNPNKKYLQCGRCKRNFVLISNNKKGEMEAYAKIKTHIQTTHRNTTLKKKLAAMKAQARGTPRFQSEQSRVKRESPRPGPSFMSYPDAHRDSV